MDFLASKKLDAHKWILEFIKMLDRFLENQFYRYCSIKYLDLFVIALRHRADYVELVIDDLKKERDKIIEVDFVSKRRY